MDFEELRALYSTWATTRWERYATAVHFTRRFRDSFAQHLSAPAEYKEMSGEKKDYISLIRLKPLDKALRYRIDTSDEQQSRFDGHITEEEEGLVFGLSVVIDRAENSWPKERILFFRFAFRPRLEGTTTFHVFLTPFEIHLQKEESWIPVFEHMTTLLVEALTTFDPPDLGKQAPYTIGFMAEAPGTQ